MMERDAKLVRGLTIHIDIQQYAKAILQRLDLQEQVIGFTRASALEHLLLAAQVEAFLNQSPVVTPDHLHLMANFVLCHRLVLVQDNALTRCVPVQTCSPQDLVLACLSSVESPF